MKLTIDARREPLDQRVSGHGLRLDLAQQRMFTLQLSVLFSAGIPILRSLESIAVADIPGLSHCADYLIGRLEAGVSLSQSLSELPDAFDETAVGLVRLGEQTGGLARSLQETTRRCERLLDSGKKLRQAMAYPLIVMMVVTGMLIFLCYYMLPRFVPIFESFGTTLPWPTRVLLGLLSLKSVVLPLLFALMVMISLALKSEHETAQLVRRWLIFELPVLGRYNKATVCADVCGDLALMLQAGMMLTDALTLAAGQISDSELKKAFLRARQRILQGDTLVVALKDEDSAPSILVGTLVAGGESGQLPILLNGVSQMMMDESDNLRQRMVLMLEPLLIGFMGLVVGFVMLACFLPIYQLLVVEV